MGATAPGAAFDIRPLGTPAELRACLALQKATWGENFTELVPGALLWAVQRIGGVVAGAFDARGELAGFVFGITGVEEGRPVHWSDMLAVRPELRNQGLGRQLKLYQREVLLDRGVETVYWTFDPLESKNAYLNFAKLGILAREYLPDLYGQTDSPVHRGIGTDRLVAVWRIASERVRRRLAGEDRAPRAGDVANVPLVNPVRAGTGGLESADPELGYDASRVRVAIPADIQALKSQSLPLAADWREKTRASLQSYLARGYWAVELVREGEHSTYLLDRSVLA
ncbi:MAG: GNAT family N-acetyltransferase [Gemmatimonadetes bacterium]|nr:GNAT family N-acetyltransferase [Gemmatimonadota bacterium]